MRTMACVWFMVIVLIGAQKVFGNICEEKQASSLNCDECIRCGGNWCSQTGSVGCNLSPNDSWCPQNRETASLIAEVNDPGDLISPIYAERSVLVGSTSTIKLAYTSKTKLDVTIEILNSTQNDNIIVKADESGVKCQDMTCAIAIHASPTTKFCSDYGTPQEFVYVKINIGNLGEPAVIKYQVACGCACTTDNRPSPLCSGHGSYSCGTCRCQDGWKGDKCNLEDCPERGDATPSCKNSINGLNCSGNGYCDHCNTCHCNESLDGSQYFDQELCSDLCMTVSECPDCVDCIANSTISECDGVALPSHTNNLIVLNKNDSLLDERDYMKRKMWVKCSMVVKDCNINYMAKREEDDEVYVMVMESCNDVIAGAYTPAPTVSIVLGVLVPLAVLVAVAGFMVWKHMNALPPVPLNSAGYTDIDAEDCVGENPLYKPATSNFNNPTYGKW